VRQVKWEITLMDRENSTQLGRLVLVHVEHGVRQLVEMHESEPSQRLYHLSTATGSKTNLYMHTHS